MADTPQTSRSGVIHTLSLILAAAPALADEYTPDARMTLHDDPPPGAAWFARVVVQNRIGTYNRVETLDTAHGPVSLEYTTTPPSRRNDPASADRVCVVALPDGVMAMPECLDVMEEERGEVFLVKWIGG